VIMTISPDVFPERLTRIDELTRPDHYYLTESDECLFLGEYTAGGGYGESQTNQLILNFKKSLDRRGLPEWRYKEQAIKQVARAFHTAVGAANLDRITFVPIPPSKMKTNPLYDSRLTNMLHLIRPELPLDVREMIVQCQDTQPAHETDSRPRPTEIEAGYKLDLSLTKEAPQDVLAIVDDMLTTGAHFQAAKSMLKTRFPHTPIIGLFIARRLVAANQTGS